MREFMAFVSPTWCRLAALTLCRRCLTPQVAANQPTGGAPAAARQKPAPFRKNKADKKAPLDRMKLAMRVLQEKKGELQVLGRGAKFSGSLPFVLNGNTCRPTSGAKRRVVVPTFKKKTATAAAPRPAAGPSAGGAGSSRPHGSAAVLPRPPPPAGAQGPPLGIAIAPVPLLWGQEALGAALQRAGDAGQALLAESSARPVPAAELLSRMRQAARSELSSERESQAAEKEAALITRDLIVLWASKPGLAPAAASLVLEAKGVASAGITGAQKQR